MSNPTIPPEVMKSIEVAMDGSYSDGCDCFDCRKIRNTLIAALPHLRRAILAEAVPFMEHRSGCNRRNQAVWDEADAAPALRPPPDGERPVPPLRGRLGADGLSQEQLDWTEALAAKREAVERVTTRHAEELEALVPLTRELARKAGAQGITVGDVRLRAQREGLLPQHPSGRQLSWLTGLPKAAGLVATDRRRLSPLPHSRNNHVVYVLPEAA